MEWGHLEFAERREWLVTDGAGGFASGTVSDVLTRRYHGLLVAALAPPVGRRVFLAKLDASITYAGSHVEVGANRWHDGTIAPSGYRFISAFDLEGRVPVTTYRFSDFELQRRVWMPAAGTTYVRYTVAHASSPVTLSLKAYADDRDYHSLTHAYDAGEVASITGDRATIRMGSGTRWYLGVDRGAIAPGWDWYYGFLFARERERGLDDTGDLYHPCTIEATLQPGESLTVVASLSPIETIESAALLEAARERDASLLECWRSATPVSAAAPPWIEQLILAADQFIVDRVVNGHVGKTIIAGYHWFGDWGRDTMISLPGLTLLTGRPDVARSILTTFARFVDRGMIPNRFPDEGETPEYNTADATLWYVEAIRAYYAATNDAGILRELFEVLKEIVDWHVRGTRFGIHVDPADGLLYAGQAGVQLTWMDAKVGDWVVTPRIGKAVEINALWYNALGAMDAFAQALGRDPSVYRDLASKARRSFARFWNERTSYLYDVLDGPSGDDATIRPNALFAVSLPFRALDSTREAAVVDRVARTLVTPCGVRSLSPDDPAYIGTYGGDQRTRDGAYHRGTAWLWLMGPFIRAWSHAYGDMRPAARYLQPFAEHVRTYGMGTLAEISDGDAPYDQRGCIAQAWSVAEILHAWHDLQGSRE